MKTKLLFLFSIYTSFIFAQLPSDYVARYDFIEGSKENNASFGESGNLSGTIQVSQLRDDRFGRVNDAIRVEGNQLSGYTLTDINNEISVSFWFQGSAPSSGNQRIFQFFDTSGDGMSLRTAPSNTLIARFKNNGIDKQSSQASMSIFDGSWHHIVFTIKKTNTGYNNTVYIDGVLHQVLSQNVDSTNTSNFLTSNAPFIISANGVSFHGNLDDFQIYKRAITDQEVTSIFNYNPPASYTRAYVNTNATGNNDGSSWSNAFVELQTALKYSRNNLSEIWVANGTYKPGAVRTSAFKLNTENLEVYGGFDGTENSLTDRDLNSAETILSGDVLNNDVGVSFVNSTRNENNYHVILLQANNVILDGFKVNNGHANVSSSSISSYGGAIVVSDAVNSLNLKNCEFNNNMGYTGGAIRAYFNTDASVEITNCIFNDNLSRYGSSLYLLANNNRTVTVDVSNSLFINNTSRDINASNKSYTGSSAWVRANGTNSIVTTTITNCTFSNNEDIGTQSGSERGTLALGKRTDGSSTHNATISNSIFYNNKGASNAVTLAVNKGHTSATNQTLVYNSIDEDSFSNLTALTNTSNNTPLFVDVANNNFKLQSSSPAINAGDNSKIPSGLLSDLANNNRIFNTIVDMGVYEFGSNPLSIKDNTFLSDLKIFPNPVKNNIFIESKEEVIKIEVYNLLGKKVLEKENSNFVDLSLLKPNMYLIKVHSAYLSSVKRIIKK